MINRLSPRRSAPLPRLAGAAVIALALGAAGAVSPASGQPLSAQIPNPPPAPLLEQALPGPPVATGGARIAVVIELQAQPTTKVYAEVLGRSPARDAQALATAAAAARAQADVVRSEQARVSAVLAGPAFNATELYRVRRAMSGIAVTVNRADLAALRRLPGVKKVHVLELEYPTNGSSVPFIGTPRVWSGALGAGLSATGAGVRVGIIDTGIDYQHATFGGTGLLADYQANDRTSIGETGAAAFPTTRVVGGWDFVGDTYGSTGVPVPDPDPMDCHGHGTHVAGTAAGNGVTSAGTPFTGPFDTAVPFGSLRIGPGTAPRASVYALRVFGCGGGTNLTVAAIDWAVDPNDDDDLSDRLDVINLSLGSPFGGLTTASAIAADNAAAAGVVVVTSVGNEGDTYFISGSPGSGDRVIATAATADDGVTGAGLRVNTPAGIAGEYVAMRATFGGAPPPAGVSGGVVIAIDPSDANGPLTTDACSPLTNAAAVAGNIALIDFGPCSFTVQVKHAQDAGASAAILVHDNLHAFGDMGGTDAAIVIPSVMVRFVDGSLFKANVGGGLHVSLFSGADTLDEYSSRGPRRGGSTIVLKPDVAAPGAMITSAQTGITCTGVAPLTGCYSVNASGVLDNSQPLLLQGTSMAAPHVAGVMALLRQLHPTWSVEELKALVMNTALHDVVSRPNGSVRYGPSRVGAGRVDPALAAVSPVVAFNADDTGQVSVSFDGHVTASSTQTKTVRVVNHGATAQTFDLGLDIVVDAPGIDFSVPGSGAITVPAGQTIALSVQMTADVSRMDHARDATIQAVQTGPGGSLAITPLPRHWLTEEAGYLTFAQAGITKVRVPLYTAAAPLSTMAAAGPIAIEGVSFGSTSIPLSGTGVCTGTLVGTACTGSFPTDEASLVSAFELQLVSPAAPASAPPYADLQYAGVSYDAVNDRMQFGVSTFGPWSTPSDVVFNILIDCGVYELGHSNQDFCDGYPDGNYDMILFNTNAGTYAQLLGLGTPPLDSFASAVYVRQRGRLLWGPEYLNVLPSSSINTRVFDNQVAILSFDRRALKIGNKYDKFNYRIVTCPGSSPLCGAVPDGGHYDETPWAEYNFKRPALHFGSDVLFHDQPGARIPVTWSTPALVANHSFGALLLHHHNVPGRRAEVVLLDYFAPSTSTDLGVTLTAPSGSILVGDQVPLTVTVTSHGPNAVTSSEVLLDLPPGFTYVSHSGGVYDPAFGLWTVGALGNGSVATLVVVLKAESPGPVVAKATITSASLLDTQTANNEATVGIEAPATTDLQMTAAPTTPGIKVGDATGYTMTVRNNGAGTAYSVVVASALVAGTGTITSGTPSMGVYDHATRRWSLASLAPGVQATLTLAAQATGGPTLTAQATATTTTPDIIAGNNVARADVTVAARTTSVGLTLTTATLAVDEGTTATVMVTDTDPVDVQTHPAGTVAFSSSAPGVLFATSPCVLTAVPLTTGSSSCQVTVTPTTSGSHTVTGLYSGSPVHAAGSAAQTLTVDALPTTTAAAPISVTASTSDRVVTLRATVEGSKPVDEGTVTFIVTTAAAVPIGTPVSAPVTSGHASAEYTLPGGTPVQTLTVVADYVAGPIFADSSATTTLEIALATELTYFFAEGATGPFFDLDLLLANPHTMAAPVTITFFREHATPITHTRTLDPTSRTTIRVDDIPGLEAAAMSIRVGSIEGFPIVAERTMRWDASGYGAHTEKAAEALDETWYFAEGSQGFFQTYLLLANPEAVANVAHVTWLRERATPLVRDYPMGPASRLTIDAGSEPDLVDSSFGAQVTFDQPAMAERAMYFGTAPIWTGGHDTGGVPAAALDWYLAEGATGSFFATYVLIANPGSAPANVTLTYMPAGHAPVTRTRVVPAGQRITIDVASEAPSLASAAVATQVHSADTPVIVERAQYWPQPTWIEGHVSAGVTTTGTTWGLAEGRVGGAHSDQTYILLANPGSADAEVTLTFLRTQGTALVKSYTVPARSRMNVAIHGAGSQVPELVDESFGTVIDSTQPIVVERSMYSSVDGVVWAAGTNATATRLP